MLFQIDRTTSTHLLRLSVSSFLLIQFFSLHYNVLVDGETRRLYTKLPNNAEYNALTQLPQDCLLHHVGNPIYPKDLMDQRAFDALEIIYNYTASSSLHENSSMGLDSDDGANDRSTKSAPLGQHQTTEALSYLQANDYRATITLMGYKGGEITKQINQDRAVIISPYTWWSSNNDEEPLQGDHTKKNKLKGSSTIHEHDFFIGVFDGHGPYGEFVSEYAATTLPKLLAHRLYEYHQSNKTTTTDPSISSSSSTTTEDDVQLLLPEDIMKQVISDIITFTFIDIDSTIPDVSYARRGGCTASVVLRYGATLFIANSGDSISFVATTTTTTATTPLNDLTYKSKIHYQTREDKPHLPDERTRIESFGGRVSIPSRKGGTSRVHYGNYGLAMSRSLGDWEAGVLGVIPDPIIHTINIPQLLRKEEEEQAVITETNQENGNNNDDDHQCVSSSSSTTTTGNTCEATDANHGSVTMFVVSGTDGLFDYVEPETVAEEIASTFRNLSISATDEIPSSSMFNLIKTCGKLVLTSAHGWNEESRGAYRDDIAIAVHKILL